MKKIIFITVILALSYALQAQKYISRNVHIWFYSHTPVEDIEAHNRQAVSILDISKNEVQFNLLIKSFEFKAALMQEHFNENYMESDEYPKASFTGKITNLEEIDFTKDGNYTAQVTGDLTIHGVTKAITTEGAIEIKRGAVTAKAKFVIFPKDYNINIPAVVEENIAKEIEITVESPYTKN